MWKGLEPLGTALFVVLMIVAFFSSFFRVFSLQGFLFRGEESSSLLRPRFSANRFSPPPHKKAVRLVRGMPFSFF